MKIVKIFQGYVRLVDIMGNDFTPVERARVSYGAGLKGKKQDEKLLRYLYKNGHLSPLEGVVLEWELKIPLFVARQLMRYRIASFNEISGRYTDKGKNEFYMPAHYRTDTLSDKQQSKIVDDKYKYTQMTNILTEVYKTIEENYNKLRKLGVAKELARIIQPVGQYTSLRMTINLRNLLHMFYQRLDEHAQYETRMIVQQMHDITKEVLPLNIQIFDDMKEKINF